MPTIKGEIIEEEVSYQGARYKAVMLRTDTYATYELSDDFREYIGYTIKIKLKHWTDERN